MLPVLWLLTLRNILHPLIGLVCPVYVTSRILRNKACQNTKIIPYVNYRTDSIQSFTDTRPSGLPEKHAGDFLPHDTRFT